MGQGVGESFCGGFFETRGAEGSIANGGWILRDPLDLVSPERKGEKHRRVLGTHFPKRGRALRSLTGEIWIPVKRLTTLANGNLSGHGSEANELVVVLECYY